MEKEESKKGFVLYSDIIHTIKKMPLDKAGELFLTILEYTNGNEIKIDDLLVEVAFEPIKQQLIRDHNKYLKVVERNRANGVKGGRPKEPKKPNGLISEPKKPDNDKEIENDSETDNDLSKSHYPDKSEFDEFKDNTSDLLKNKNPKNEKKGSAEKKEKEVAVGWHSCVGEWQKFYFSKFNSKPSFGAIEAKHLKSIYNRLKNKVNDKNEIWNEETALEYLKDFLFKAWNDNWLKANFLIPNLSSKFDAIINKTGTNENQWQTGGKKVARFSIAEATKRPTFDTNRPTKETDKSGDINLIHIN